MVYEITIVIPYINPRANIGPGHFSRTIVKGYYHLDFVSHTLAILVGGNSIYQQLTHRVQRSLKIHLLNEIHFVSEFNFIPNKYINIYIIKKKKKKKKLFLWRK